MNGHRLLSGNLQQEQDPAYGLLRPISKTFRINRLFIMLSSGKRDVKMVIQVHYAGMAFFANQQVLSAGSIC